MSRITLSNGATPEERWAAQIAALDAGSHEEPVKKDPITVARIVDVALTMVKDTGFDSLTMRRVAAELQTGPASLYAHVRNKAELDDLLIGHLCTKVLIPTPDAARWTEQIIDVCTQLRDQFLAYPGISRAALAAAPRSLDTTRISEGMLAILLAGGVEPRDAAWAIDAAYLYVSAYSLEVSLRRGGGGGGSGSGADHRIDERDETIRRLQMLPVEKFPNTVAYAQELTSGNAHERFDFTVSLLFGGLKSSSSLAL